MFEVKESMTRGTVLCARYTIAVSSRYPNVGNRAGAGLKYAARR